MPPVARNASRKGGEEKMTEKGTKAVDFHNSLVISSDQKVTKPLRSFALSTMQCAFAAGASTGELGKWC